MINIIIPFITVVILIYGIYKKVDIYQEFINGVKDGIRVVFSIFPTIFAMYIAINVLIASNVINDLSSGLGFIFDVIKFPRELFAMAVMRPISGSSSLALLDNILKTYGPDSYIGFVASIMQGSTDTTIYILSLYFSSVGIKKIRYSLVVGLLADLSAIIISLIVVKMFI